VLDIPLLPGIRTVLTLNPAGSPSRRPSQLCSAAASTLTLRSLTVMLTCSSGRRSSAEAVTAVSSEPETGAKKMKQVLSTLAIWNREVNALNGSSSVRQASAP